MKQPDFLCIGLPKSGTTWLYHHLRNHEQVWLPPVKEIAYLQGFDTRTYSTRRFITHKKYVIKKKMSALMRRLRGSTSKSNEYDALSWYLRYALLPESKKWYQNLFPDVSGKMRGDISPQYHVLEEAEIQKIKSINPEMKVVLILRDPVDRLWSQAKMKMSSRGTSIMSSASEEDWTHLLEQGMQECPAYVDILDRWRLHFPDHVHIAYYDQLAEDPQRFFTNILEFLGLTVSSKEKDTLKKKVWQGVEFDISSKLERYLIEKNLPMVKQFNAQMGNRFVNDWIKKYEQNLTRTKD
ncbi:MAG: sulfotransferase [Reichenbachiella sp.]|uniref:sulfotransferase family protein n=1 Tax=Reichenbachiella sp. TaxID=2184521 RepID=UPI00326712C4